MTSLTSIVLGFAPGFVLVGCAIAGNDVHPPGSPDSDGSDGTVDVGLGKADGPGQISYSPTATPTLIDDSPGAGNATYSYRPSIAQTSTSSRHVYYCGDTISGLTGPIHDHVMMTVGTLEHDTWHYTAPVIALDPSNAPPYATMHTCDPSIIHGAFGWGGHTYAWAMLFTATGSATGPGDNQVGAAFADTLDGPWTFLPHPLISSAMEPAAAATDWGLGQPRAVSYDKASQLLVFYKLGSGPEIIRTVDLKNVLEPAWLGRTKVSTAGLPGVFHSGEFAYEPTRGIFIATMDSGTMNTSAVGPNVQPNITVAALGWKAVENGTGTWSVVDTFGKDLSGEVYNANSGIVRDGYGWLPAPQQLGVLFTVSDPTIEHGSRGVFENRLWDAEGAL